LVWKNDPPHPVSASITMAIGCAKRLTAGP
jgi:hypothetical protein